MPSTYGGKNWIERKLLQKATKVCEAPALGMHRVRRRNCSTEKYPLRGGGGKKGRETLHTAGSEGRGATGRKWERGPTNGCTKSEGGSGGKGAAQDRRGGSGGGLGVGSGPGDQTAMPRKGSGGQ